MFSSSRRSRGGYTRSGSATHTSVIAPTGLPAAYPLRLNFYNVPPQDELTIDDFESCALDRLRVLRSLETALLRKKSDEEMRHVLAEAEGQSLSLHPNNANPELLDGERAKDNTSHFVLRLAYARSEDLREWFVKQETLLFRLRLERETQSDRSEFIRTLQVSADEITSQEKAELLEDLAASTGVTDASQETFYKVRWTRVTDLVGRRRCLLRAGTAYLASRDFTTLIVSEFRLHLTKQMEVTARFLPRMEEDERILPLLNNMNKQDLGRESFNRCSEKLTSGDVEPLSRHFPPCMRHLHETLKREKHLRHGARLQYGLFLKGIGLPVEEALTFWRRMFTNTSDDAFQKNYAYNVRYNYGLEGKRVNFGAYSCSKIITSNAPGPGEHHGCPFRHFSGDRLRQMLSTYGAPENEVAGIAELAGNRHYQLACTRFYEATRRAGEPGNDVIEHPNKFHQLSLETAAAAAAADAMLSTAENTLGVAAGGNTCSSNRIEVDV